MPKFIKLKHKNILEKQNSLQRKILIHKQGYFFQMDQIYLMLKILKQLKEQQLNSKLFPCKKFLQKQARTKS